MEDMNLFNKDSVQEISTDFDTQYVQDSLIQIWGGFLGYPINYLDLNKIKDGWGAIYQYSKETFENASPNDFNTVIDFVISAVDSKYGIYRHMIFATIKSGKNNRNNLL